MFQKSLFVALAAAIAVFLLDLLLPPPPAKPYSTVVTDEAGRPLHVFISADDKWRIATRLESLGDQVVRALLFKEDKYFYYHPGINPAAMVRALFNNIVTSRRTSGASTITMQVVRLLEPRERTYAAKLVEVLRALQLELHYSKREILELYLSLAPFGGNIEGIEAASRIYFNRPPAALSLAQLTALIVIPNRPTSLKPGSDKTALLAARNKWLAAFQKENYFSEKDILDALAEPLEMERYTLPREAPHLSFRLARAPKPYITTTLHAATQQFAERQVSQYIARIRQMGISNAAVLIVDNPSRAVRAYVGAANFNDIEALGQVDGVQAVRSPGSTLKPLVYGLAMDAGLVTPGSIVADVPINFGGYAPENYNEQFNGPVTISTALALSLNIPAVRVLDQLGIEILKEKLKTTDFSSIAKNEHKLGLSMILGGCGVRLWELAGVFSAYANGGVYRKLHVVQGDTLHNSHKLLSPESAFMVTSILTQLTRPDLPTHFENSRNLPLVAWKTGTSYGRRDAWAVGYNAEYTVAVWCGNFNGAGSPALAGAEVATPLLFQIFNDLNRNQPARNFTRPASLLQREVCGTSGNIPDTFCTDRILDDYIPGVSHTVRCTHKKWVWTNAVQTESYCADCKPGPALRSLLPDPAPEIVAYWRERRIPYTAAPPHNPRCTRIASAGGLRISSPPEGAVFYSDSKNPSKLALEAHALPDSRTMHWFINGSYYGKAAPGKPLFFLPDTGSINISLTDDRGRTHQVRVHVHGM